MKYFVVWKYEGRKEERKGFANFADAMRFQSFLVKNKKGLEYAKYE